MSLLSRLEEDLRTAVKSRDSFLVSTLKFLLSEIRNREIELRGTDKKFEDEEIIGVIRKEIKKRKEAASLYQKGGRGDLMEKEEKEIKVLSKYLPQPFSVEELTQLVRETIQKIGAKSPADFGKVMGAVMAKTQGRAEGAQVAEVVKKALS